ncbi:hypothetical protein [Kibdelosporangium persicum]|uniref:hypothetical protein n=1 Tax=Kibdelosporangium persicum TaxID=2698649 RepID=UPI001562EF71|nr:hypothetical protein [Kibdelosporangium persicum]
MNVRCPVGTAALSGGGSAAGLVMVVPHHCWDPGRHASWREEHLVVGIEEQASRVLGFFQQRFQFGVPAAQTFLQPPRAARDVDEPLGVGRYGDDGGSCFGRTDCGTGTPL